MEERKCERCIWFDQCGKEKPCEYYEPASEEEADMIAKIEYEADLRMRHDLYMEYVKEQDE